MLRRPALTILAGLLLAGMASAQPEEPSKTTYSTPGDAPIERGTFITVNTDDIRLVTEGIETHLRHALEHSAPERAGIAVKDLRKAAAGVRIEAARAPRGERSPLLAASDSLEALSDRLSRAPFPAENSVRGVAAFTQMALARHLWRMADASWASHESAAAAREMEDSVDHVGLAGDWRTNGLARPIIERLESIRNLARVMQAGETGWSRDQVGPALADLQSVMDQVEAAKVDTGSVGPGRPLSP